MVRIMVILPKKKKNTGMVRIMCKRNAESAQLDSDKTRQEEQRRSNSTDQVASYIIFFNQWHGKF